MPVIGLLLLAGLIGVPVYAAGLQRALRAALACAAAGAAGLALGMARFAPGWAAAGLLEGPLAFGAWLALWSAVGWARRRRAAATPPTPSAG